MGPHLVEGGGGECEGETWGVGNRLQYLNKVVSF